MKTRFRMSLMMSLLTKSLTSKRIYYNFSVNISKRTIATVSSVSFSLVCRSFMQGRISVILYLALLYVLKSKPKENNLTNILDAEPDHIQQPKLQNHVVEITRVIHRLLILEPDNPGAISLHNDFLDTLHNRFYGHEGWQSEWHKPRHAHLLHGQGFQDHDVTSQKDDNGGDEWSNKES